MRRSRYGRRRCSACGREIALTKDGSLRAHTVKRPLTDEEFRESVTRLRDSLTRLLEHPVTWQGCEGA